MTAAILALFLAGTHVCPVADIWVAGRDGKLRTSVVCVPWSVDLADCGVRTHVVELWEAKGWPAGSPCTAYVRNGDVTSRAEGDLRRDGDLTVCVPGGGS